MGFQIMCHWLELLRFWKPISWKLLPQIKSWKNIQSTFRSGFTKYILRPLGSSVRTEEFTFAVLNWNPYVGWIHTWTGSEIRMRKKYMQGADAFSVFHCNSLRKKKWSMLRCCLLTSALWGVTSLREHLLPRGWCGATLNDQWPHCGMSIGDR